MAERPTQISSPSQAQAGFSLIEVILTLAILSLLMGLVSANLRGSGQRNAIKAEQGQLALVIEELRTISLHANRDLSLQDYLAAAEDFGSERYAQYLPALTEKSLQRRRVLAGRVSLDIDLIVRPPGACSQATGQLRLSNGRDLRFDVTPLNCAVRLG